MNTSWFFVFVGLVMVVIGLFMFINRDRASKSITDAQRAVFPFLAKILANKTKSTGVVMASVFGMVLGIVMSVLSLVSVFIGSK